MSAWVRSVCPYDCPDTCGLLVEVEEGRALSVRGDPDHPYSQGTLCPKMNRYERTVHSSSRLTRPLVRTGPKGEGRFRPATWPEAIALVAGRWKEIAASDGPEAILPYSYAGTMGLVQRNAGHAFFHRLGASRLDRAICDPAKSGGWDAVMGNTPGPIPEEVLQSDLVVLWGINAVATSIHFAERVKRARSRGAEVWLIDTYETPTAALADRVFLVKPASDGVLALGLMHVLARHGWVDEPFLKAEATGWEALRDEVLPQHPPEQVAAATGLAAEVIVQMAERLGRSRAPFIRVGAGLSRYGNGGMNVRAICCLPAVTGAWARPGGGCLVDASSRFAFPLAEVVREDLLRGHPRIVNMNRLGHALSALRDPPIRSLCVYASNPAATAPDQNAVLEGLRREELFTVVHERFLTDTARFADVVLPATTSLEHPDLYRSYGHYAAQRTRPVLPPLAECKSNWELFQLLAGAMGFDEPFFQLSADDLIDRLLATPAAMRAGIDPAAFAEGRAVELRLPDPRSWMTPSGKIELRNPALDEPLPRWVPSHADAEPLPFRLATAPAVQALNTSFQEREELRARQKGMRLLMNPDDAAARGLRAGDRVRVFNALGEAIFLLDPTPRVPRGLVVAEGVFWLEHAPGPRTVNALTSQRLTDIGAGSTFYDNRVDVQREG